MKLKVTACMVAFFVGAGALASGTTIATSDDLDFIIGSGDNLSVLVIDFNNASGSSFAWGYRWDGEATGADLLAAVAAADSNLLIDSNTFLNDVSYFDGSAQSSAQGSSDTGNFWSYFIAGGSAETFDASFNPAGQVAVSGAGITLPDSYTQSTSGTAGRLLENGSWDAFSFGPFPTPPSSGAPFAAAVPEPSVTGLVAVFFVFGGLRRKR